MSKTRKIAFIGMFVAMEIALTRFAALMPSTVTRISLSFIAFGSAGLLFGPKFTMLSALIGDLIGATLFPQGTYVIGFTISAVLTGYLFGQLKKHNKTHEVVGILLLITLVVEIGMNTLWLSQMFNVSFIPMLVSRVIGILINLGLRLLILLPLINQLKKLELFNEN